MKIKIKKTLSDLSVLCCSKKAKKKKCIIINGSNLLHCPNENTLTNTHLKHKRKKVKHKSILVLV